MSDIAKFSLEKSAKVNLENIIGNDNDETNNQSSGSFVITDIGRAIKDRKSNNSLERGNSDNYLLEGRPFTTERVPKNASSSS